MSSIRQQAERFFERRVDFFRQHFITAGAVNAFMHIYGSTQHSPGHVQGHGMAGKQ